MAETYDYIIIGSGFGGSVSAMRLAEKGYRVLVLERGKRFADEDFPKRNWNIWKFLWLPALRCFGILQMTFLNGVLVLHGSGVGGGSLGYANTLMEPSDELFDAPDWRHLADWKKVLRPHYDTAKRMLGVIPNPRLWRADIVLKDIATELGTADSFQSTEVGIFFGDEGKTVPDPFFNGEGPDRAGCIYCGGCMVGCRHNAKNTLPKNYLYFAEKWGVEVRAETTVTSIQPLSDQSDEARYAIHTRSTTAILNKDRQTLHTRNVILSAGVLGTVKLLMHCRDVLGTLPAISSRLGQHVRTNSEAFAGSTSRGKDIDYSEGIAISSVFKADEVTHIEPVRYPDGSSFIRLLSAPIINYKGKGFVSRLWETLLEIIRQPYDFFDARIFSRWARRSTIFLIMQTKDSFMRLKLGRSPLTLFQRGLVSEPDPDNTVPPRIDVGVQVSQRFAEMTDGVPMGAFNETLLDIPTTAHIMGGVPFGRDDQEGVVDLSCEVFNYPGLYVIDGSIMPANPGINPSLTITALAEYAMSQVPARDGNLPVVSNIPLQPEVSGVSSD